MEEDGYEDDIPFVWLHDELYNKGKFLMRGAIQEILSVFNMYGQQPQVIQALEQLTSVFEDWGFFVRGDLDKPISFRFIMRRKE